MVPALVFWLFFALAADYASPAAALYSAGSPVMQLTDANFEAKVKAAGIMMMEVRRCNGGADTGRGKWRAAQSSKICNAAHTDA